MRDYIIFDGVPSTDCGVMILPKEIDNAPKRDLTKVKVPGRNGSLIIDNGRFEDVTQVYSGIIYDDRKFDEYITALKAVMLRSAGYKRLEDTFHPEEYRMAYLDGNFSPDVIRLWKKMGKFELKFTCKPQRFLKIGERMVEFTASSNILRNPTGFISQPFIRAYGYGSFSIDSRVVTISQSQNPWIDIDCERMDAYYGESNCNSLITLSSEFPVLYPETIHVILGNHISKLEIKPNWWTL